MLAQIDFDTLLNEIPDFKFKDAKLGEIIAAFIPYVFAVAGILLLLYIIYGGFTLMTSAGDPKSTQEAKLKITHAAIGFVIVFTAYWVIQLLGLVLGITEITNVFK